MNKPKIVVFVVQSLNSKVGEQRILFPIALILLATSIQSMDYLYLLYVHLTSIQIYNHIDFFMLVRVIKYQ